MAFAEADLPRSLRGETLLHPADAFPGYVYKQGEWGYNQAITPYPSWGWWGITDRVTAELDFEAWLGGVPSFNFRVGALTQEGFSPTVAFETMFQYINIEDFDQFDNLDYLDVSRNGVSWYNRINLSWRLQNNFYLHLSGGSTYSEYLQISNSDSLNYVGKDFNDLVSPDVSLGLGWRCFDWVSFHSSVSYGSTFLYADNIPRKQQYVLATRIAPFLGSNRGYLKNFRFELAFLYANFPDAEESIAGPIGFLYWQWE